MKSTFKALVFASAIIAGEIGRASAQGCIATLTDLVALQDARGNNVATPVTYIMCPNTVYVANDYELFELNGNASYLCGSNGSSSNNCIVRGGFVQVSITVYPYDYSEKDNILLSGFTFERAEGTSGVIAAPGNFKIRDCIFKDHNSYGGFAHYYYIPPTVRRGLSTNDKKMAQRKDFLRFLTDPHVQLEHMRNLVDGPVSRSNTLFERCQFLNNTMTSVVEYPTLLMNGPFGIISSFADVTMTECLFKDNFHDYRLDYKGEGYNIYVESGSTLNISKSCFVNNVVDGKGPIWVRSDSGLVSSSNNYLSDPEPLSPCEYLFKHESHKCKAPESTVCLAPACDVVFKVYNVRTQAATTTLTNGTTISAPPCNINIEAILPCLPTGIKKVKLELLRNGSVVRQREEQDRFFLFGNVGDRVSSGNIAAGTYTIRATVNGVVQPKPITFTLAGSCAP